jgi:hypothetical protein
LVPEKDGHAEGRIVAREPAGAAIEYVKVPALLDEKSKVNEPTLVATIAPVFHACAKGRADRHVDVADQVRGRGPLAAGITSQSGLKLPGDAESAARGSYVYQTANTWLEGRMLGEGDAPSRLRGIPPDVGIVGGGNDLRRGRQAARRSSAAIVLRIIMSLSGEQREGQLLGVNSLPNSTFHRRRAVSRGEAT